MKTKAHPTEDEGERETKKFKHSAINQNYVDKTQYIEKLEEVNRRYLKNCVISFRPPGFGKSTTISMLQHYYDVSTHGDSTFNEFYIGKNPTELAHQFLVLLFEFSGIETSTYERFAINLNEKMNSSMKKFQDKYQIQFKINENNAVSTLRNLVVSASNQNLYILVDDHGACINEALKNIEILNGSSTNLSEENNKKMNNIESKMKQLFYVFKELSEKEGAYVFVTGVTPMAFTHGMNNSFDICLESDFDGMYGFTDDEAELLLNFLPENMIDCIKLSMENKYGGYRFNKLDPGIQFNNERRILVKYSPSMYNCKDTAYCVHSIHENYNKLLKKYSNQEIKKSKEMIKNLLKIPDAENLKPPTNVLKYVIKNTTFLDIARDVMQPDGSTKSKNVWVRHYLSSFPEDIKRDRELPSFLYSQGVFTHSNTHPDCFVLPNETIKILYLEKVIEMLNWKSCEFEEMKLNVMHLVLNDEIKKLTSSIENIRSRHLSENQKFTFNETSMYQMFVDSLRFSLFELSNMGNFDATTTISRENSIDISISSMKKRIIIQFKRLCTWDIDDEETVSLADKTISRNEDIVLNLRLKSRLQNSHGMTVGDYFEACKQQVETENFPNHNQEYSNETNMIIYLVLQIGLTKLIAHKFLIQE